jgi:hypothetical protein
VLAPEVGTHRKQFTAAPDQDDLLLADTAEQHAAIGYGGGPPSRRCRLIDVGVDSSTVAFRQHQ